MAALCGNMFVFLQFTMGCCLGKNLGNLEDPGSVLGEACWHVGTSGGADLPDLLICNRKLTLRAQSLGVTAGKG